MKIAVPSVLLPILSLLIAIAAALLVGTGLILLAGANPRAPYTALFQESLYLFWWQYFN